MFYDKHVEYGKLHPFGCLCYYTNIYSHKDKFENRVNDVMFLGFAEGQKGFKLLDLKTHFYIISRDVVFHERSFPSSEKTVETRNPNRNTESIPIRHKGGEEKDTNKRRSAKNRKQPAWMQDYVCRSITTQ